MYTSRQILDALQLKSQRTLNRWEKAGVIPPKVMDLHSNGIGRAAKWEPWVLAHGRRVQALLNDGNTLSQIAEMYGTDWDIIAKRYQKYNFADVSLQKTQVDPIYDLVDDLRHEIARLVVSLTPGMERPIPTVIYPEMIIEASELAHQSFHPILVIDNGAAFVTTDFAMSSFMAKKYSLSKPMPIVAISLWAWLCKSPIGKSLPKKPPCKPIGKFVDRNGEERAFKIETQYRVKIDN